MNATVISTAEILVSQPVSGDVVLERVGLCAWVRREILRATKSRNGYELAFPGCHGWYPAVNVRNIVLA